MVLLHGKVKRPPRQTNPLVSWSFTSSAHGSHLHQVGGSELIQNSVPPLPSFLYFSHYSGNNSSCREAVYSGRADTHHNEELVCGSGIVLKITANKIWRVHVLDVQELGFTKTKGEVVASQNFQRWLFKYHTQEMPPERIKKLQEW